MVVPCTGATAPSPSTTRRLAAVGSTLAAIVRSSEKIGGTSVKGSVNDGATLIGSLVRIRAKRPGLGPERRTAPS